MKKSILTVKNENRKALIDYLKAKKALKDAKAAEKAAKAAAAEVFAEFGKAYKESEKTEYLQAILQQDNAAVGIVYKETTKQGSIDWQAYALALGGTEEGAEEYRGEKITAVSIDYATKKQAAEMGL